MTTSPSRFACTAALTGALGLAAALAVVPASAGDHKLAVSAVILARDTCQITSDQAGLAFRADASSPVPADASMNASLQCSGTATATTVRIQVDRGVSGGDVTGLPYRPQMPAAARLARGVPRTLKVGTVRTAGPSPAGARENHEGTWVLTIEP